MWSGLCIIWWVARWKSFLSVYFKDEQMQTHQGAEWFPSWGPAWTVILDLVTSMPKALLNGQPQHIVCTSLPQGQKYEPNST